VQIPAPIWIGILAFFFCVALAREHAIYYVRTEKRRVPFEVRALVDVELVGSHRRSGYVLSDRPARLNGLRKLVYRELGFGGERKEVSSSAYRTCDSAFGNRMVFDVEKADSSQMRQGDH
jgi:hypothetical protein